MRVRPRFTYVVFDDNIFTKPRRSMLVPGVLMQSMTQVTYSATFNHAINFNKIVALKKDTESLFILYWNKEVNMKGAVREIWTQNTATIHNSPTVFNHPPQPNSKQHYHYGTNDNNIFVKI